MPTAATELRATRLGLKSLVLVCSLASWAAGAKADGGIAIVGPMTGAYSTSGAAIREAAAANLANASAPSIIEDDRCRADTAAEVAHRIAAAKPPVVIGHPCSSAAIAAAPIYAEANIPFISTGARHGDLTDKRAGPLVYRLSGRDDRQGRDAAAFLARASGGRPIAILHDRTFAMSAIAAEAAAALTGPPGPEAAQKVMQFPFVASELNYDGLVEKVVAFAGKPEDVGAVFFAGYPAEAVIILRAMRAHKIQAPLLAVDALADPDFGQALAPKGDIQIFASREMGPPGIENPEQGSKEGDGKLGEVRVLVSPDAAGPQATRARTAAAIRLWQLLSREQATNPAAAIATTAFDDPELGRIMFDAKGDAVIPSYLVSAWRDGAWKPVAASELDKIPSP